MEIQPSNEVPPPSVNSASDAEQLRDDAVVPDASNHGYVLLSTYLIFSSPEF